MTEEAASSGSRPGRIFRVDSQDLIRAVAFDFVDQLSDHAEVPIAWADLSNHVCATAPFCLIPVKWLAPPVP